MSAAANRKPLDYMNADELRGEVMRLAQKCDRNQQTIRELAKALKALIVAVECGKHEQRLEASNPLCVAAARAALAHLNEQSK